jgi:Family of unknown function (DUF6335)
MTTKAVTAPSASAAKEIPMTRHNDRNPKSSPSQSGADTKTSSPQFAVPAGFQSTRDPMPVVPDETVPVDGAGLSRGDDDVAWEREDPLSTRPGIESDRLGAGFDPTRLGDETGDASSPRPDENIADEIGAEVGVTYQEGEELDTVNKVAERDRDRWELRPASSEDFVTRSNLDDEELERDGDDAAF